MANNTVRHINIIGHQNPDTDSICSALAYAWLKNRGSLEGLYEARRAGHINRETRFVLQHFGVEPPRLCTDVSPQIKDIDIRKQAGIDGEMSVRAAWNLMRDVEIDTLCIVENTLTFVEAPMCHWPDTMVTYADKEEILFSNDVFGQHYATESLYDDTVNQKDLFDEAEKYYANILNIYNPMVNRKVKEIVGMNLPLKMVAPSHGVIWTNHIGEIVEKYLQWSTNYQEHQITIIYDTMWQSTRRMAQAIADGIREFDPTVRVVLMNAAKDDKNDILVEVFRSKAIMVGSPTVNMGITYAIAGLLEMIHGMKCKNKKAAAFGSIGWGGGGEKRIQQRLEEAGFEIAAEPGKQLWAPDMEAERKWREYGKAFAAAVLGA